MSKTSTYETHFRRRREETTNYRKRLALLKSGRERFVVRKNNNRVRVQLLKYRKGGDEVVASACSAELHGFGWKMHMANTPAAYLTGLLCGLRAVGKGAKDAVADTGLATPVAHSAVFAAIKGGIDAGLMIPSNEEIFPDEGRICGRHIAEYAAKLEGEQQRATPVHSTGPLHAGGHGEQLKRVFSTAVASGADPKHAEEHFKKCKEAIIKKFGIVKKEMGEGQRGE